MVLTDWFRRWPLARGDVRKQRQYGAGTSRLQTLLSRHVEVLEDRSLLAAVLPDFLSLATFGGDFGPFQVAAVPLAFPTSVELSAATFAGQSQFQTAGIQQTIQADDFVAVDVSKTYALSGWAKSGDEFGLRFDPANRQSFGIAEYDSDHLAILPIHVLKFTGASDTTLATALNPGDTQVQLVNAAGWSSLAGAAAMTRAFAWYGYTNSAGQTYADFTYTRNVAIGGASGLWDAGSVNEATNTITLNSPWSGPALTAGTEVRNATGGSEFQLVAMNNQPIPGDWTWTSSTSLFGGGVLANGTESANRFRPGTAFIKPVLNSNDHGAEGNFVSWRDVAVQLLAAGTSLSDIQQPVIDLASVTGTTLIPTLSMPQIVGSSMTYQWSRELVRVNTAERFEFSAITVNSSDTYEHPLGFASYDSDSNLIHPLHVTKFSNAADTRLAAALTPGATSILVNDATGWSNSVGESAQTRSLAWYGYANSSGQTYADYTYTRNVAFDFDLGLWDAGAIAFDAGAGAFRIALRQTWDGPTIASGTAVRNATGGSRFNEITASPDAAYGRRAQYTQTIGGGVWQDGQRDDTRFRPGTAFIQPVAVGLTVDELRIVPEVATFANGPVTTTFDGQSVVTADQSLSWLVSDQFLRVDPTRSHVLSAQAVIGADLGTPATSTDQHSLGFVSYDWDHQEILPIHVTRYGSALDTTLAVALNPGDTTVTLTDATGWSNLGPSDTRAIAWYGYRNSAGQMYPDFTYTRNVAFDRINGLWDFGAIHGNVITLRTPWAGPSLAVGASVRNAADRERLNAALLDRSTIPNSWTDFSAMVSGVWTNGVPQTNAFRPGTSYILPAALLNATVLIPNDVVTLREFSVRRSDAPLMTINADANHVATVTLDVLANDPLAATTAVRIQSVTLPQYGSVSIVTGGGPGGRDVLRYVGATWFVGRDSFEYTVRRTSTGELFTTTATVQITGSNFGQDAALGSTLTTQSQHTLGNTPPTATDNAELSGTLSYETSVGRKLIIDNVSYPSLLANDNGSPDTLAARLISGPDHGTLKLNADGTFEYTPDLGFVGLDHFHYAAFDGLHSDRATATIRVVKSDDELLRRQLKSIGLAMHYFHDANGRFTIDQDQPAYFDAAKNPYLSWRVHLLPFLGYTALYQQFHLNEPWNSSNNLPLLDKMPAIFRALDDIGTSTRFQVIGDGENSQFFWRRTNGYLTGPKIRDYVDGYESTILVALAGADKAVAWTKPDDLAFNASDPVGTLGNLSSERMHLLMADGAVATFHTDLPDATFQAMTTLNSDEVLDIDTLLRAEALRDGGSAAVENYGLTQQDANLKSVGLAFHNYHDTHLRFPLGDNPDWFDAQGKPKLSWRVHLLPYLGQDNLYQEFHLDEAWDSPNNLPLLSQMPDVFRSAEDLVNSNSTRLQVFTGADAPFLARLTSGRYLGPRISDFQDGTSNTILVTEVGADRAVLWTKPDDILFDVNNPLAGLGDLSSGVIRFLNTDGSISSVGTDVVPATFKALVTPKGLDLADGGQVKTREEARSGLAPYRFRDLIDFKAIGLGMYNFRDTYSRFPWPMYPSDSFDEQGQPKLSWRVWILPFIDQEPLYRQFHLDEAWDSPHNLALLDQMPDIYRAAGDPFDSTTTQAQVFTGPGAPFLSRPSYLDQYGPQTSEFTDGTSNTFLVVQSGADKAVPWTSPEDIPFDPANPFGSLGTLGDDFLALFADANTRRLSSSISASDLKAYITHRGGEIIPTTGAVGFTVTPTDGSTFATEGRLDALDVVLTRAPLTDVVITIGNSATNVATLDKTSLRFTSANWNVPQRVTVLAIDDLVVDDTEFATLTLSVDDANSDNAFDALADQSVEFANINNDTPGLVIAQSGGVSTVLEHPYNLPETYDSFTVALLAQPTSNVVVLVASGDATELTAAPATMTFTPSNWSIPQTVYLQSVDDIIADGTQATFVSLTVDDGLSDDHFDLTDQTVPVAVTDNESPSVWVKYTDGDNVVSEDGASDTFTVELTCQPLSNVVLDLTNNYTAYATINKTRLTFSPANWNVPQVVTLTGVDDPWVNGTKFGTLPIRVNVALSDSLWSETPEAHAGFQRLDNDVAGFTITELGSSTSVTEGVLGDTFTIALTGLPLSDVVLQISSADIGEVTVSPTTLTFGQNDWNIPKTVNLNGVADLTVDDSQTTLVTVSVVDSSSNDVFDAVADQTVSVTTTDSDVAGFTVTQTGSSTSVAETGTTDTFTVVLSRAPVTDVVIQVTCDDVSEAAVAPATLTFTNANWNVAQTVTVTGVDDTLNDGDQSSTVTLSILDNLSNDAFDSLADKTVQVTTLDVNHRPTISDVSNQTLDEDTASPSLNFSISDVELAANNLIMTATSSNTALIPNGNLVLSGSGASRSIVITPAANLSGSATIMLTVSDGTLTATDTFVVTINAVNDAPTISDITDASTNEDSPTSTIAFTVGDLETAVTSLTVTASSSDTAIVPNANIVFSGSGANRSLVATPAANQSGTTTITVTVSDGSTSSSDSFVLTVNAVNDAPTISNIGNQTTDEDTSTSAIAFTVGDLETAAGSLTVTATSSDTTLVPNGNVTFAGSGANRTMTVTPAANQSGTTTIAVTVSDGTLTTNDTFVLTVNGINDAPSISNITNQMIDEDLTSSAIAVTIGDLETAAGSLALTATSSDTTLIPNANLSLGGSSANRTLTIASAANRSGTATITLTVSDGSLTATDTFVVTVNAVNDTPTLNDIPDQSISEDTATSAITINISDLETSPSSLTVTTTSSNTTLVPNANLVLSGTGASRTLVATPSANQFGTTTITVSVSDGTLTIADTFVLTVNAVNDVPTIGVISNQFTDEDLPASITVTIGDIETSLGQLTLSATSSNTALIPAGNLVFSGTGANRTLTMTPALNQSGTATIRVSVNDGSSSSAAQFLLAVNSVNDLPTISNIADQSTDEDTPTSAIAFNVGDAETLAANLTVAVTSSNAALVPNANLVLSGSSANRTLTATPNANQFGTTTITVSVNDGSTTTSDQFLLTVHSINDAPSISDIAHQTINRNTSTSLLNFTVGDVELIATDLVVTVTSSNSTLVPASGFVLDGSDANRTLQITPAANLFGTATITVTVSDGVLSSSDTLQLTVNENNQAPSINNISNQTTDEDVLISGIEVTVGDEESSVSDLIVTATSSNGTLIPNTNLVLSGSGAGRLLKLTPSANQSGISTITLTVSDGRLTSSDTFLLTVNAMNDTPAISSIADQTINEDSVLSAVFFTIGDVETSAANLTVTASSSNPTLVPSNRLVLGGSGANRSIQATPAAEQSGNSTITISVSDGLITTTREFLLTVNSVNDLPTLSDITNKSISEDTLTAAIPFTISDKETATGDLIVTATSSDTNVVPNGSWTFGGSGASRTLTVIPGVNAVGTSTITFSINDGSATVNKSFVLTVTAVNDAPTVSDTTNQTTNEDTPLVAIPITIGDAETTAGSLTVTVTSSNTTLVPANKLMLGGSGTNRTLTITPATNLSGSSIITVKVSDGTLSTTDTFVITVNAVNDVPTITDITNKITKEDTATAAIPFTIGDLDSPLSSLIVTATSSNTTLVPNAKLLLTGTTASRSLKITPAANQFGTTTISVTVSDGFVTRTDSFVLTVTAVNDPPTISNILNQSANKNTATNAIPFTIGDIDSAITALRMNATSSNTTLIPNANIVFTGTGVDRTLKITPALNRTGTATITVRVTDGSAAATDTFVLTVSNTSALRTVSLVASPTPIVQTAALVTEELVSPQPISSLISTSPPIAATTSSDPANGNNSPALSPMLGPLPLTNSLAILNSSNSSMTGSLSVLDLAFSLTADWDDGL